MLESQFKCEETRGLVCAIVIESQGLARILDGIRIVLSHFIHFRGAGENARLAGPRCKLPALCEARETNHPKHKNRHHESGGPDSQSFSLYSQMEFRVQ
ncbi:MAG: hypothetical protein ACRD52_18335 [Candidatus Acidiferrales bacterium]